MGSDAVRPWVDQLPALSMGSLPIKQSCVKMRYELSKVMGVSWMSKCWLGDVSLPQCPDWAVSPQGLSAPQAPLPGHPSCEARGSLNRASRTLVFPRTGHLPAGLRWPHLSFLAVVVHSAHFLAPLPSKQLALFVLGDFPYLLPHFREAHNSVFQPFDCSLFKLKQLIRPLLFSFCSSPSSPAAPPHPFSFKWQLNLNPFSLQKKNLIIVAGPGVTQSQGEMAGHAGLERGQQTLPFPGSVGPQPHLGPEQILTPVGWRPYRWQEGWPASHWHHVWSRNAVRQAVGQADCRSGALAFEMGLRSLLWQVLGSHIPVPGSVLPERPRVPMGCAWWASGLCSSFPLCFRHEEAEDQVYTRDSGPTCDLSHIPCSWEGQTPQSRCTERGSCEWCCWGAHVLSGGRPHPAP